MNVVLQNLASPMKIAPKNSAVSAEHRAMEVGVSAEHRAVEGRFR
ncbi:MAG: hypothetical protein U1E38_02545 [Rhodospirillales bacterium]